MYFSLNKTAKHDIVIVMGDFNAKIDNNNKEVKKNISAHAV